MKLDFSTPNGTYPYTPGNGRSVIGTQYPNRTFSISSSSDPAIVSSWSSTLPVTAIIVKVGNLSYAYPYKPFRLNDNDLVTGDSRGISHVTICYTEPTNPTAADATVSGRVVNTLGMGISKASIVVVNGATGETKVALTNPFGYYSIGELEAGDLHILNVSHKRYTFQEAQRVVTPNDNLVTADLIGQPK